ncbi:MAG: host-nuclease inhibitor Gam family protein [Acidimicrobiia bacterium]
MTELADALTEPPFDFPHPSDIEGRQRWAIANYPPEARDKIASWAMRRLAALEAEKARLARAADAEAERVERWLEQSLKPLVHDEAFFKSALTEYLRHIRDERGEDPEKPKTLTYKLPTGTIVGRRPPERIEVLDEEKFIAWAKANGHPELVRVKEEVDKQAIKKATVAKDGVSVIIEGERLPFVEARRGREKLDAKPEVSG